MHAARSSPSRRWSTSADSAKLRYVKSRMAIRLARNPMLAALLLVTYFARALVPAGFMPGPGGLMLCPAYGPSVSALHAAMGHDMSTADMSGMDMAGMAHAGGGPVHGTHSQDHDGSSLCPFAAAATTMVSGHTAIASVAVAVETGAVLLPEPPFVPRGTIVPTRLPRGPPSLA